MKFRKRIGVLFLIISSASYLAALTLLVARSVDEQRQTELDIMQNTQVKLQHSMTRALVEIGRLRSLYIIDDRLRRIIYSDLKNQTGEKYLDNLNYVNDVVGLASRLNPYILGVTIITSNQNIYTNTGHTIDDVDNYRKWIDQLENSTSSTYYTPVYDGTFFQSSRRMLSIVHRMDDLFLGSIGYIVIDVDFKVFTDIMEESFSTMEAGVEIRQGEKVIYSKLPGRSSLSDRFIVLNETYDFLDWQITQSVSKADIYRNSLEAAYVYLAVIVPIWIVTGIIIFFATSRLVSPITELSRYMSNMRDHTHEYGQEISVPRNADEEIDVLYKSFNDFIVQLRNSMNNEYKSRINQKNSELLMLQSQINPHFVYNTLNLISSIAVLNDIENIPEICGELSDILRYSLCTDFDVTLEEELDLTEKYINIHLLRYPDKIKFTIDVPKDLKKKIIQRFTLQPMVENSMKHGMRGGSETMKISIQATKQNGVLVLRISDDGTGIERHHLQKIRDSLLAHDSFDRHAGFGIRNVHYRIQDRYGEEYGVLIDSRKGQWTALELRIPISDQKTNGNNI